MNLFCKRNIPANHKNDPKFPHFMEEIPWWKLLWHRIRYSKSHIGNFDKFIFPKFSFPLMRSLNYNDIGKSLLSVEPMKGPIGLTFALKYQYNGFNASKIRLECIDDMIVLRLKEE